MGLHTLPAKTTRRAVTQPLRAAIYGRASSDPKKRGRSIKDQFAVAELDCHENGWTIAGYYEDRDRSASRAARKSREEWERLTRDVEAGRIDVIVYAERSRASRNMETFMLLRKLCMEACVLLCYGGRVYDMSKPGDRKDATRDAMASEEEAESIIERAERTSRLNAHRGAPHGRPPFGFMRRYDPEDGRLLGQFPHPEQAEIVRDLFARAAAQESVNSLWEEMRNHVPDISRLGVRYMLKNKAYIGVRVHRGQDMKNCQWPAIVDEGVFWQVQSILGDPSRLTRRESRIKHLLSCLAACSKCVEAGARWRDAAITVTNRQGALRYRCPTPAGHAMIRMDQLDLFVQAAAITWLASDNATAVFQPTRDDAAVDKLQGRLANMRAQVEQARKLAGEIDDEGRPRLSIESLAATEQQFLPLIDRDEKQLQALTAVEDPLLNRLVGAPEADIATVWERLDLMQRRHVLRRVVNVDLRPAGGRGVRTFDPARVRLTFAGQEGFEDRVERGSAGWAQNV